MRGHLLEAIGAARGGSTPARRTAEIENHCDLLAGDGIRYHEALPALRPKRKGRPKRRPGHKLAIRLRDFKAETLRSVILILGSRRVLLGFRLFFRTVFRCAAAEWTRWPLPAADGSGDPDRDAAHGKPASPGLRPAGPRRSPRCPPEQLRKCLTFVRQNRPRINKCGQRFRGLNPTSYLRTGE